MNEFDSIRITEKGDTLSFEMTNELADSSHEAIFFLIRATSALIASVTKDDAGPAGRPDICPGKLAVAVYLNFTMKRGLNK